MCNKDSPIYTHNELDIRVDGYGRLDNPSMKLLFCLENQEIV